MGRKRGASFPRDSILIGSPYFNGDTYTDMGEVWERKVACQGTNCAVTWPRRVSPEPKNGEEFGYSLLVYDFEELRCEDPSLCPQDPCVDEVFVGVPGDIDPQTQLRFGAVILFEATRQTIVREAAHQGNFVSLRCRRPSRTSCRVRP